MQVPSAMTDAAVARTLQYRQMNSAPFVECISPEIRLLTLFRCRANARNVLNCGVSGLHVWLNYAPPSKG
jgi:hypothetical protein